MRPAPIALLLKSYGEDLAYAERLIESFHRHNIEELQLYCVVPDEDLPAFQRFSASTVSVLAESLFGTHLTDRPVAGIRPGYINQEVVKIAFWELGLAKNYFCIDSEAVFLRNFGRRDFLAPDGFPYTVLVEDNELKSDPVYYREHWVTREASLRSIARAMDLDADVLRTCHGHQVFSSLALRSFKEDFLEPRSWTYLDALGVAPYEFTWYNFWVQKSRIIPIHQREPHVKVFHSENQHIEHILSGVRPADLARGYVAAVVNSNFSRDQGIISLAESKAEALGPYLSYGEVLKLLRGKAAASLRRLRSH